MVEYQDIFMQIEAPQPGIGKGPSNTDDVLGIEVGQGEAVLLPAEVVQLLTPELLAKLWDNIAERYADHKRHEQDTTHFIDLPAVMAELEDVFRNQLAFHPEGLRVADIGIGTGDPTIEMLNNSALGPFITKLVGVDFSAQMLQIAQENLHDPRISLIQASADDPRLPQIVGEKFHVIMSIQSIDCVQDLATALKNVHELLEQDGVAVICIKHPRRNAGYAERGGREIQPGYWLENWGDGVMKEGEGVVRLYLPHEDWDSYFDDANLALLRTIIPRPDRSLEVTYPEIYQRYARAAGRSGLIFVVLKNGVH
jgi:ubiquinone/menaquinone biosynthesis C-methylase UbiE